MNTIFRVDSSSQIGLGHLMRCMALAEQYEKDNVVFAVQELEGHANQKIIDKGYEVVALSDNSVNELCNKIELLHIDGVVFDHYDIDDKFEKSVKEKTGVQILSFDDTYEKHHCNILLNHNIYADAEKYKGLVPKFCEIRCGKEYTLIREEFKKVSIRKRPINKKTPVVFVSLGGVDANNISLSVLEMLVDFDNITINLATTSSNQNINSLQDFSRQYQDVNICIDCNIAEMMNDSDCAIISPSVTAYEAMYLDLPFLAIQTADNQHYVSDYLVSNNFLLGDVKALNDIKPLIQSLLIAL